MALVHILILAIIQGIAEFLPISSSGHLVVLDSLFRQYGSSFDLDSLTTSIVLHLGTLVSIIVVFWKRILLLLGKDRRVLPLVVVGSIPAAVFGLTMKLQFEEALKSPLLAGFMFLVTGGLLLWTRRAHGTLECRELSYSSAILIGLYQAFAVLPGISRSGSTIAAGLLSNLKREEAAAFSFLLAIPAIAGAGLIDVVQFVRKPYATEGLASLAVGAVVSCVVGIFALWWLIRWLEQGRLEWFAYWVLALGPIVIVWRIL